MKANFLLLVYFQNTVNKDVKKSVNKKPHLIDVHPIRSKEQIEDMKWALKRHYSERDYILFLIGIHTGLRVSDLLQIETQTIVKLKRKKRKEFKIKEGKTEKERMINLTSIFDEVYSYAQALESTWLFPSRKGDQSISKIQAYRQLQKAGDFADVESIGTHTMRKTFGYWFYKQTKDVAILQEILNHNTPQITLEYIGINKEKKDNILDTFFI